LAIFVPPRSSVATPGPRSRRARRGTWDAVFVRHGSDGARGAGRVSGSLRELFSLDAHTLAMHFATLALAFIVTLPVGWDQERSTRAAGIRTFPLVAVGAAAYVMLGRAALGDDAGAHSRLLQGLITGIGFIGGGAILKTRDRVRGTATAASLWSTAAIGAAVAYGEIDVAILLSAINFLAL